MAHPLKQKLYSLCLNFIERRIETCELAIKDSQNSANEETKSSAGDKYETGRAMAQLDIEKNSTQLAEAKMQKKILEGIDPQLHNEMVQLGSLVITNHESFYVAIAAGQLTVDNKTYFAVSPISPIAKALAGHKTEHEVVFNKKTYQILKIQ